MCFGQSSWGKWTHKTSSPLIIVICAVQSFVVSRQSRDALKSSELSCKNYTEWNIHTQLTDRHMFALIQTEKPSQKHMEAIVVSVLVSARIWFSQYDLNMSTLPTVRASAQWSTLTYISDFCFSVYQTCTNRHPRTHTSDLHTHASTQISTL